MKKFLFATSALALMTMAADAATMKAVYTGTVRDGNDQYMNVFGTSTSSLAGLDYVLTYIYDTAVGTRTTTASGADKLTGGTDLGLSGATVLSAVLTINGHSYTIDGTTQSEVQIGPNGYGNTTASYVARGVSSDSSSYKFSHIIMNSTLSEGGASVSDLTTSFDEAFSNSSFGYFWGQLYDRATSSYTTYTWAYLYKDTLTVTNLDTPAAVPLPATVGLLAAAIGGLGVAARRRRQT